uniref:Uncharacterized protein n=3 Tax=Lotus japonicus TaxID=34305 RepID=I3T5I8_LOTJA|nr:unknown [Lotus japonicus]
MGDSETVVADASAAEAYAASASAGHADTVMDPVPEAGAATGEASQANSAYGYGEGNVYARDPNSGQLGGTGDSKQAAGVVDANEAGNAAAENSVVPEYNSTANGSVVTNAAGLENGNAVDNVDGSADEKQLADGYAALSAEEDRLWNIVSANS